MHEPQAAAMGFSRPEREVDRLAEETQFTCVGGDNTGQDLDQRAFPRAILAEQPMDFARPDSQLSLVEGQRPAVSLNDAAGVQKWRFEAGTDCGRRRGGGHH